MTQALRTVAVASVWSAALALAGCASEPVQAPVSDIRPPLAAKPVAAPAPTPALAQVTAPPGHYVIKRGDTLYSIALEHGADYRDVARWNALDDPTKISVGQVIRVTPPEASPGVQVGAARGRTPPQARPLDGAVVAQQGLGDGGTKTVPKALRLPYSEENLAMLSKGDATAAVAQPEPALKPAVVAVAPVAAVERPEPPKPAGEREAEAIDFIWPAKGGLLAKFSEPSSKGLDIGGKAGDPVIAAAAGQVLYTGTGIRGFG